MNVKKPGNTVFTKKPVPKDLPQESEYDTEFDDNVSQTSTTFPTPSKKGPDPSVPIQPNEEEIQLLQQALIQSLNEERSRRSQSNNVIKHAYSTSSTNVYSTQMLTVSVNQVAQGTASNQRNQGAIENVGLTCRFKLSYVPGTTVNSGAGWKPPGVRILLWKSLVPNNQAPVIADVVEYTTGVPTSNVSVLTSGRGANDGMNQAFRNPITFDRIHVEYDELHYIPYAAWSQGGTIANVIGAMKFNKHFKLFAKTNFSGTIAASVVTDAWYLTFMSDALAAAGPTDGIQCEGTTDFTFVDSSDT